MVNNSEDRTLIVKTIVAGGLVFIGLATGTSPVFSLLVATSVNIGGNLITTVVDSAVDSWSRRWFGDAILRDPIRTALGKAFDDTIRHIESDWRETHAYHYLIYKSEFERAKLSLRLLRDLRVDAAQLMQSANALADVVNHDNISTLIGSGTIDETDARKSLSNTIAKYLNVVEELAEFVVKRLPDLWLLHFIQTLQDPKETSAWRAYQLVWQESLGQAVDRLYESVLLKPK